MTVPPPVVSVIIPAQNAAVTLPATLNGLNDQREAPAFEVIVVDDGSSDATATIASEHGAIVIRQPRRGPAHARNVGAAAARGERLAFLDADCRPTQSWLTAGTQALAVADFVVGATLPDPGKQPGPFDRTLSVTAASALFESANLFVIRDLFERLGGFESWLAPRDGKELGEDVWLGWRARRLGARMAFCREAVVHHAVFPRGPLGFVAERRRLRFFPAMARRIPELRQAAFYRRWFLTRRSAMYDLAVVGVVLARATSRRWPLAAAGPYGALAASTAGRWGRRQIPVVLVAGIAADTVSFLSLLAGSARCRSPLL